MMNLNSIMTGLSKLFLFAFLGGFALTVVVHAQQDQPAGFISIDCGIPENSNYADEKTGIYYSSDAGFIDSGESKIISPEFRTYSPARQFLNVKSFPEGKRNCYTLRPAHVTGNTYLVRAWFMYGNYDLKNQTSQFGLYIGVDFWDNVTVEDSITYQWKEIIHVPPKDYINVCLVNIGLGTPFITALELRPLNKSMYETQSGSLNLFARYDMGSTTNQLVRYKDDIYDRIWRYFNLDGTTTISGSSTFPAEYIDTLSDPPHIVMSTANTPNASDSLYFSWVPDNPTDQFYIYLHFTEVQVLKANESRAFLIYLNGELWYSKPVIPSNLTTTTIYGSKTAPKFEISINKTSNSTLPPIINAIEVYNVRQLNSPTDEKDGKNLSSSGLTGEMSPSISNLTMIESLDLSNNNLIGQVPDFLSQLAFLKFLNLKGNNFTGLVPAVLLSKSKDGSLSLSIDGVDEDTNPRPAGKDENTNSSQSAPWKIIVPVVVLSVFVTATFAFLWVIRRRKQVKKVDIETNKKDGTLEEKKKQFTYSEVLNITSNFQRVIGKGGFGIVYHGYIGHTQVAVKMLSPSSTQGYNEFQAEANLLISVHHKNLTSLVGYCNEGTNMGIIYEFMANGDLRSHLSDRNPKVLMWEDRLRIAVDAAQG
ncbi:hypothetical protein F0562_029229 [Nyssa sinensis]|uniref:non-specific serine/threonine protein kinase n=1 Tax=Nyssa sinensis TaxID=561372 RepID=A0A5J5B6F2_9ASTE|nr:hypothetical protein F0562_029229 [Nyssa sinensis]